MNFFDIMFGKKYGTIPFSKNYFDTLFAAKLAEMQIKTLTGTLPLTFRTSETALRSWTIYGNNTQHNFSAEGTLPLTFTTHTAGAASDWVIEGNDNIGKNICSIADFVDVNRNNVVMTTDKTEGTISVYTTDSPSANTQGSVVLIPAVTGNYLMSGIPSNAPRTSLQIYCWDRAASARAKAWDRTSDSITCDKNNTEVEVYLEAGKEYSINVRVLTGYGTQTPVIVSPMVRLDGTSSTFEPYQIGVGQRTANIFTNVGSQNGYLTDTGGIVTPHANLRYTDFLTIPTGATTITFAANFSNSPMNTPAICFYDASKNFISGEIYAQSTPNPRTFTVPNGAFYCRTSYRTAYSDVMLVEGSTAPQTYIPHGYQIPLTVSQTGQTDKTYDIYIGDSPLTAGQSISKTSTGVDIAAIAGSNTITTDLYNKPSMSIEGVDYVGVGAVSGDKYSISVINSANISPYKPNAPESNTSYVYNDSTHTLDTDSQFKTALISWQGGNGSFTITKTKGNTFILLPLQFLGNWSDEDHYVGFTPITPTGISYTGYIDDSHLLITYYDSEVDTLTPQEIRESITVSASVFSELGLPLLDAPLTEGETLTMESIGHDFITFAGVENTIEPFNPEVYDYGDFEMSITYKGG